MNSIQGTGDIFSALASQSSRLESLASNALAVGIDAYQRGNYDAAARSFRLAISYSPASDNALNAYDYIAQAYVQMGKPDDAIKAYKDAVNAAPTRDDFYSKLGMLYYDSGNYADAETAYASASRLKPSDGAYLISLGQAQLAQGKYDSAEAAFRKVIALSPNDKAGYYALGQAYAEQGRPEDAAVQFQTVIDLTPDFTYAYVDLGSAYVDMGKRQEANDLLTTLKAADTGLAATLEAYMFQTIKPRMVTAYAPDGFDPLGAPGTLLSSMNPSLTDPNSSQTFRMVVYFDKKMDMDSIEDTSNWSIQRADGTGKQGFYNFALPVPSTEVLLPSLPESVSYNYESKSATITFRLTQNADGTGTIDPSHVMFRFTGLDAYGNAMDSSGDEFSGFSRIV